MARQVPLGVLVSGSGTNLQSIIDNCRSHRIDAEIRVVVSDNRDAYALKRAESAGIPTAIHLRKDYTSRRDFESAFINSLTSHGVELVCLAGFMRIISPDFLKVFSNRIINIHPALLPSFPGLHAQEQAFHYGVKVSGCTVHFVDAGTDTGPIILQATVPVLEHDTAESLKARILEQEHQIYPRAIQLYAEGRLEIQGRHVVVK